MPILNQIFSDIAYKKLARVDIYGNNSNQHEITATGALRDFFNTDSRITLPITWFYFNDDRADDFPSESGIITYYDSRENHPTRTEWRIYYQGDFLTENSEPDDLFVLVKISNSDDLFGLIFRNQSLFYNSIIRILNLDIDNLPTRTTILSDQNLQRELNYVETKIVEALGFDELIPTSGDDSEFMRDRYPLSLPPTREMAELARSFVNYSDPITQPDRTLLAWLQRETELFRAWEKNKIDEKIRMGFSSSDEFLSFSTSLAQVRKSRRGQSLEHHLEQLFSINNLEFTRTPRIENNHRPDFIFPGVDFYNNPEFESNLLTMLAAKSTAKERWRQILEEADRIDRKHFCTLDQKITNQTIEDIIQSNIQLVIPEDIINEFYTSRSNEILTLNNFVTVVREKQIRSGL